MSAGRLKAIGVSEIHFRQPVRFHPKKHSGSAGLGVCGPDHHDLGIAEQVVALFRSARRPRRWVLCGLLPAALCGLLPAAQSAAQSAAAKSQVAGGGITNVGWIAGIEATTVITALLIGALLARLAYLLPKQSALTSELEALRNSASRTEQLQETSPKSQVEPPSDDALHYEGLRWLTLDFAHDFETTFSDIRQKLHSEGTFSETGDHNHSRLLAEALLPVVRSGERTAAQLMSFAGKPKGAQPADLHPAHHSKVPVDSPRGSRPWELEALVNECLSAAGFESAHRQIDPSLPAMTVGRRRTAFALHCILSACRRLMTDGDRLSLEAHLVKATGESTDKAIPRHLTPENSRTSLRNTGNYVQIVISGASTVLDKSSVSALFYPSPNAEENTQIGVGFAAAKEILRRQRGSFAVAGRPTEGTRFTMSLPLSESTAGMERRPSSTLQPKVTASAAPPTGPKTGKRGGQSAPLGSGLPPCNDQSRGRILVMDDEQSILALLSAALRRLGFDPVTTTHGEQALAAATDAQQDGQPFKLAILDLTIPGGMGGVETAEHLNSLQPDLILVASSGYAQNPALLDFKAFGFNEVLVKPYRIPDLSKLIDRLVVES